MLGLGLYIENREMSDKLRNESRKKSDCRW